MARLRAEALKCPQCPNLQSRRRVVWGEGNLEARVMVVGQGPGAVEEEVGRPFVGPAGNLLDQALAEAGLRREELWITNLIKCRAVKKEGKRVVDRAPRVSEIKACRPWLEREIEIIAPRAVVCLGSPAAQALIDKKLKLSQEHGQLRQGPANTSLLATFHPAYILRLRSVDPEAYERTRKALVGDLKKVSALLKETR